MRAQAMDHRSRYKPLLERSLENVLVEHLSRRFDFGKDSRVARLLVEEIVAQIDKADEEAALVRIRPFELFLKYKGKPVRLPMLRPEYVEPLVKGETFSAARRLLEARCMKELTEIDPQACRQDLLALIHPRALVARRGPTRMKDPLTEELKPLEESKHEAYRKLVDAVRIGPRHQSLCALDRYGHGPSLEALSGFVNREVGLGKAVSRRLVEEVVAVRNLFCPLAHQLHSGQMPAIATHTRAYLSQEVATRYRRHAPVILTVVTPEELKRFQDPRLAPDELTEIFKKRILRVTVEAYRQHGLLTLMDMQWIFQVSGVRVGEMIRSIHREAHLVLPTPGTILDAGRSLTHKEVVVYLYLQGYSVMEIAKMTYHSPRAVDNYIGTFDAVLILYLYGLPTALMASVLKRGEGLIREHLELATRFLQDRQQIVNHLKTKGMRFSSVIS
jgi:hypothetical protein